MIETIHDRIPTKPLVLCRTYYSNLGEAVLDEPIELLEGVEEVQPH